MILHKFCQNKPGRKEGTVVYLLIIPVLFAIFAIYMLIRNGSQSHSLPGGNLLVKARLSENKERNRRFSLVRHWFISRRQREYEISEYPAPALVTLSKNPARIAKAGLLDRLSAFGRLPMELSLTPLSGPCRFLVKTAAFIILLGGLLNGGSAKVDNSSLEQAPKKEKGSFPPYSWDDFCGRSTGMSPHAVNISDCPMSISLGGKAYAAVDCLTGSDVHTFRLRTDAHSNSSGHGNHSNVAHTNSPEQTTTTAHSNSPGHSNATDGTSHMNGGTHSQYGP
jgi:hypothetical protein